MYMQQPSDADMGRHGEVSRMTVSGRKLTYKLKVIQQPERARACGAGAKSSADRRPVDPPPVVELRIFEGEGPEAEDITFGYNANFFLFATLEIARPIAVGRVHPPPQQQVPVLTGMPVSGMAYLDRPTEAGYFIFPDLSVRHEGQYKLSFNLYEETKEAKDADLEQSPESQAKSAGGPAGADSSFDWRLEVKSAMFHVFSAKKFPGLAESTPLSRTVAEQGCRVRIRRDVRMRRRVDGKPAGDYDEHVEEPYARGRTLESEPYQRPRSDSASSIASEHSHHSPNQRDGEFQQAAYPPHTPQQPGPYRHLGFGSAGPQQQAPPQFAPPAPVSQPYQQHPGPPAYQAPPPPPAPPQSYRSGPPGPPGPPQPSTYMYDRQYPLSAYPTNPPRESFEPEPRRASVAYPPSHSREFPPVDSHFARPPYHPYNQRPHSPPPQSPVNLAPLKMAPIEPKLDHSSPLAPVKRIAPFPSPAYERPQSYSQYPPAPPSMDASRSGKRAYDSVFKSSANTQSLYNHQRPDTSNAGQMYDDDDDELSLNQMRMSYKRADGSNNSRELPPLQ